MKNNPIYTRVKRTPDLFPSSQEAGQTDPFASYTVYSPQNGWIIIDEVFKRHTAQIREAIVKLEAQHAQIQGLVDQAIEQDMSECIPEDEAVDNQLSQYRAIAELLEDIINILEGTLNLCEWLARQYDLRLAIALKMDVEAYAELQELRRWKIRAVWRLFRCFTIM